MNVQIREEKPNSQGEVRLALDFYHEGKRWRKALKGIVIRKGRTEVIRKANAEAWEKAEVIRSKSALDFASNEYELTENSSSKMLATEWMDSYVKSYKKKDVRNMKNSLKRFKEFLLEKEITKLRFRDMTPLLISEFQDKLCRECEGEGSASYFARFKKMMKAALDGGVINKNPAASVKVKGGQAKEKEVLTMDEIQLLSQTPTEATEMRRAFLFSCMTGLRFCDIKTLTWANVKHGNMKKTQSKTEKNVQFVMNDSARKLLGNAGKSDELVFEFKTANGWNKSLQAWVKRAGIDKHITWHCARHSVGTNLSIHGENVVTIASILGHASLKYTGRYVRASDQLKQRATDKLALAI